jgi:hypothetical protein
MQHFLICTLVLHFYRMQRCYLSSVLWQACRFGLCCYGSHLHNHVCNKYFSFLTCSDDSLHETKEKAVTIRNMAWISFKTSIFFLLELQATSCMRCWRHCQCNFLHEVLATLSVNRCYSTLVATIIVCEQGVWCGLWSTSFVLLGSTLPLAVSIYFTWWMQSYCSFQCDVGCSLQCSNTENVTVLTNRAGNSYIGRNTSCNLFCNN